MHLEYGRCCQYLETSRRKVNPACSFQTTQKIQVWLKPFSLQKKANNWATLPAHSLFKARSKDMANADIIVPTNALFSVTLRGIEYTRSCYLSEEDTIEDTKLTV